MDGYADLDLGDGVALRTLTTADAELIVEATATETEPALWGPRPAGPYAIADALAVFEEWNPDAGRHVAFGLCTDGRLLGAVGLMLDEQPGSIDGDSAELCYWVRPENRRQGLALRGIGAITEWGHRHAGLARIWLEIDPANTASQQLAQRAGYLFEARLAEHCRRWAADDPAQDSWHDCLIWTHAGPLQPGRP